MASKCDSFQHPQRSKDFYNIELNNKLKPLDDALRCRICFDYFNNCMITKCSHNYCSVCIRRYMMYKAQCPICFQDASEPELRNNRLIDEVLRTYIIIKETLKDVQNQSAYCKPVEPTKLKTEKELPISSQDNSEEAEEVSINENQVSCPVCYKLVLKDRINIHLDSCLKIKEKERYSERKTLPKLVYHLLSDKEIRKKLKEHGLNSTGDRQSLIRRHKNFLTLYNANCDSLNPKPVTDILLEIEKQELEERLNSFAKPIQVNKRSDASEIEKEHELYAKQHQSHFNALIQDLHQRHIEKVKVKQEIEETDFIKIADEPIVSFETNLASGRTASSSSCDPGTCQSNIVNVKTKAVPEEVCNEMDFRRNVKQEPPAFKIVQTRSLSKSDEKMQDLLTNENLSSLDDYETGKITELKALRKRKKGKAGLPKSGSPKRK